MDGSEGTELWESPIQPQCIKRYLITLTLL
jgi:Hydroxymethylglutaryl-coenzyme A synthase C terminal